MGIVAKQGLWQFVQCRWLSSLFSQKHKKHDKRDSRLLDYKFFCTELFCLCKQTYCFNDSCSSKCKFSCRWLNRQIFEDSGKGPMAKFWEKLEETESIPSTNCSFRKKVLMRRHLWANEKTFVVFPSQEDSRRYSYHEGFMFFVCTMFLLIFELSN